MEESKLSKSTNQHHRQSRHHNYNHRRAATRAGGAKVTLQPGTGIFRMLCHVNTAGGVIGNSGSLVKQLENQTGCNIRFEEPLPNCHERVINVIGDSAINRRIPLKFEAAGSQDNEDYEVEVSAAQEGLLKVFERVLETEGNGNGVTGCRLLAVPGQIGGLMGRGGCIVDGIRRNSGAKIRVLKKDQIPACAAPEEELIQIMGDVMAVKKAIVAVSHCLQACVLGEGSHLSPYGALRDAPSGFLPNHNPPPPSFPGSDHNSVGLSLSEHVDRFLSLDEDNAQRKVMFRLLCSNGSAGGVIGKGATIIKSLEKETGASITFSSPVAGSKERIATISSLESKDPLNSAAQIATVRVFARSVEVGVKQGFMAGLGEGKTISARILVAPNQINCLIDDGRRVASDVSAAFGVEIQLMGADPVPNCSSENDKVVQIVGEYENVKGALFQVTGRLRDNLFCNTPPEEAGPSQNSYSAIPDSSPHGKWMNTSDNLSNLSSADRVNRNRFVGKVGGPHKPGLQGKQFKDIGKIKKVEDGTRGLSGVAIGQKSVDAETVANSSIEVVVPKKVFGSVYGENGSNLARLKEISGATILVEDPSPGKCDGKVIISGTHERIQIAESLLRAFLLT
ncbi:hypothetical protein ACH5RR_012221 [Cinchona calisaya]|uniref:K Homology domain-containing protein n=1 Tax=Cinchona calisaya TaxID=153742 RepID=A0ABD3AAS4_9GENT